MTATLSRASRIVRRFRRTWAEMDYAQRRMIEIRTGVPQAGGPSRGHRRRAGAVVPPSLGIGPCATHAAARASRASRRWWPAKRSSASSSASTASAAFGPRVMAIATERLSVTIGFGAMRSSRSYSPAIWAQVGRLVGGPRRGGRRSRPVAGRARAARRAAPGSRARQPLLDRGAIPAGAVLVGERDQLPVGAGARPAPGVREQHQRQQAADLGVVRKLSVDKPRQPDRLRGQLGALADWCLSLPCSPRCRSDRARGARRAGDPPAPPLTRATQTRPRRPGSPAWRG